MEPVCCRNEVNIETLRAYDPQPKNKDGSVRWYLFRWDDGKNGSRRLVRCRQCGALYLVQSFHLHKFAEQKDLLFEDWYAVRNEAQGDQWNQTYTGIQLEHSRTPAFRKTIAPSHDDPHFI